MRWQGRYMAETRAQIRPVAASSGRPAAEGRDKVGGGAALGFERQLALSCRGLGRNELQGGFLAVFQRASVYILDGNFSVISTK